MKKLVLLLVALSASIIVMPSFTYTDNDILKSTKDSISYATGVNIGNSLKKQLEMMPGGTPNIEMLVAGLSDALNDVENMPIRDNKEATALLEKYFQIWQEREFYENQREGEVFLMENRKKPGIAVTRSGLQYQILIPGMGEKPTENDKVRIYYEGSFVDGTVFETSNEPVEIEISQVIPGWREALKLMQPGAKWIIFMPHNLGYGENPTRTDVKPFSALIYEIELIDIIKQ